MDKASLYRVGLAHATQFLNANGIPHPEYIIEGPPHALNKWQAIGLYSNGKIWVDIKKTTAPRMTRGPVWSWPGYKVDRTAAGVVCHETGHYVSDFLKVSRGEHAQTWLDILKQEKALSGYEPTPEESFAEAMRLYILNPHLLECGRPQRYWFIKHVLNLNESFFENWWFVLRDAPSYILEAAAKFAGLASRLEYDAAQGLIIYLDGDARL